jgi:transcriptional regulator with XRE-family HTH domain
MAGSQAKTMAKKARVQSGRKVTPAAEAKKAASLLKAFRQSKGWTAKRLADEVGVSGPNIIYAFESGDYAPSSETFIKLGNLADEWKFRKEFLRLAGVSAEALDRIADLHAKDRAAKDVQFVDVAPLYDVDESIPFPSRLLTHPASVRFVRLRGAGYPFKEGDVVLIDPTATDIATIEEGAFILTSGEALYGPEHFHKTKEEAQYHDLGILRKHSTAQGEMYLLERPLQRDMVIAASDVIGRVVGWVGQGEHKRKPHHIHEIAEAGRAHREPEPLTESERAKDREVISRWKKKHNIEE